MTRLQQIHYRTRLWPAACEVQKWSTKDDAKRCEITMQTTGQDTTVGLSNKQVSRLFRELEWLADPMNFDKADRAANTELADAQEDLARIIWRIEKTAKEAGFNAEYLTAAADYKCKAHGVRYWQALPRAEMINFSKTITSRALSKRAASPVQTPCTDDILPASKMPF